MLRIIRRYQKGVLGLFAVLCVSLAMAGFGLDMLSGNNDRSAITVNDARISYNDYYQQLRNVRERYRQMFGPNFEQLSKSLNLNLNQEVVDQMIDNTLIQNDANSKGLAVGDQQLKSFIKTNFNDTATYAAYLRQAGLTGTQFEARMREDLIRNVYVELLDDVSFASQREAEALVREEETKFSAEYVEFSPAAFLASVPARPDAELEKYFEENTTDFQIPSKVSYDFVVIDPAAFLSEVHVTDEDIAFHLTQNEQKYTIPEAVRVRHIQLLFPKKSDPKAMADLKSEAETILARARAGESFDALVMAHSDDITTKSIGGEIGWVSRGQRGKEFDDAVFKLQTAGIPDLISTDTGYQIVKIEEYRASKVKDIAEVRGEIEQTIRSTEAPAYAATRSQEILDEWKREGSQLADVAARYKLTLKSTATPLDEKSDPDPTLQGLTATVIGNSDQQKQLVELSEHAVLVAVKEYTESSLPAFGAVKSEIVEIFKAQDAKQAARVAARAFAQAVATDSARFEKLAKEQKLVINRETDFSKHAGVPAAFSDPSLQQDLFSGAKAGTVLPESYAKADGFVVVHVSAVTPPTSEQITTKTREYREQEEKNLQQILLSSILNRLKKDSRIDFDQNILSAS